MKKDYQERARDRFEEFKKLFLYDDLDEFKWEQKFILEEQFKSVDENHTKQRNELLNMIYNIEKYCKKITKKNNKKLIVIDIPLDEFGNPLIEYNLCGKAIFGIRPYLPENVEVVFSPVDITHLEASLQENIVKIKSINRLEFFGMFKKLEMYRPKEAYLDILECTDFRIVFELIYNGKTNKYNMKFRDEKARYTSDFVEYIYREIQKILPHETISLNLINRNDNYEKIQNSLIEKFKDDANVLCLKSELATKIFTI